MTISRISTVVSTNWLREQLGTSIKQQVSKKLRILDTSFIKDKDVDTYTTHYQPEHIPQSLYFGLHNCVESSKLFPRNLPEPHCFSDYVQSLGVWPDTHVIAYDRFVPTSAFRTWWLFRLFGHKNISVLDGGLSKWIADGHETTSEMTSVEPSNFKVKMNESLIRNYDNMRENIETNKEQLVDARSPEDDTVVNEEKDGGVIPGAIHLPFEELFNEDGTLKSGTSLSVAFDSSGVNIKEPMVASCLTGMKACAIAAAAHVLDKDIPVYYGSWTEWRHRAPEELKHRPKS